MLFPRCPALKYLKGGDIGANFQGTATTNIRGNMNVFVFQYTRTRADGSKRHTEWLYTPFPSLLLVALSRWSAVPSTPWRYTTELADKAFNRRMVKTQADPVPENYEVSGHLRGVHLGPLCTEVITMFVENTDHEVQA